MFSAGRRDCAFDFYIQFDANEISPFPAVNLLPCEEVYKVLALSANMPDGYESLGELDMGGHASGVPLPYTESAVTLARLAICLSGLRITTTGTEFLDDISYACEYPHKYWDDQ